MTAPTPERPGDATNGERTPRVSDVRLYACALLAERGRHKEIAMMVATGDLTLDLFHLRAVVAAREAEIARLVEEAKAEGRREGWKAGRDAAAQAANVAAGRLGNPQYHGASKAVVAIRALPIDGDTP